MKLFIIIYRTPCIFWEVKDSLVLYTPTLKTSQDLQVRKCMKKKFQSITSNQIAKCKPHTAQLGSQYVTHSMYVIHFFCYPKREEADWLHLFWIEIILGKEFHIKKENNKIIRNSRSQQKTWRNLQSRNNSITLKPN